MPASVIGYGTSGELHRSQTRVFEGGKVSVVYDFPGPGMNNCESWFWTARWNVDRVSTTVLAGLGSPLVIDGETDIYAGGAEITLLDQPAAWGGYLSGFGCSSPIFAWGADSASSNLADVLVEFQIWDAAVGAVPPDDGQAAEPLSPPSGGSCDALNDKDSLPLQMCDEGPAVRRIQDFLNDFGGYGLESDGQYGPATRTAMWLYQTANGLPATGICDFDTWALMFGSSLPGHDLNGDGVITPEEVVYD